MPLLSDREAFDRAAMRRLNEDWRKVGELLNRLVETGDLSLKSEWESTIDRPYYRVQWDDGSGVQVECGGDDLLNVLERVDENVSLLSCS